jgi:hypothetical protein
MKLEVRSWFDGLTTNGARGTARFDSIFTPPKSPAISLDYKSLAHPLCAQVFGDGHEVVLIAAGNAHGIVERAGEERCALNLGDALQRFFKRCGAYALAQFHVDLRFEWATKFCRVDVCRNAADRAFGDHTSYAFGGGVGAQIKSAR